MGINRRLRKAVCEKDGLPFKALQKVKRLNAELERNKASGQNVNPPETVHLGGPTPRPKHTDKGEKVDSVYFKKMEEKIKMKLEEVAKINGFESVSELHSMVAKVDLSSSDKIIKFKNWQHQDGTKAGLLKLLEV